MFQIFIYNADGLNFFLEILLIHGAINPADNEFTGHAGMCGFVNFKN